MDSIIPATATIAFWINAKVGGMISDTDFANACESHLGMALAIPDHRVQINSSEIALDRHHILGQTPSGKWVITQRDNSLVALDPTSAKQTLLENISAAVDMLTELPTIGTRDDIDEALGQLYSPHLPPLPARLRESLELAIRIRLVCQKALVNSQVPSSPSRETLVIHQLRHLDDLALALICAIASNA